MVDNPRYCVVWHYEVCTKSLLFWAYAIDNVIICLPDPLVLNLLPVELHVNSLMRLLVGITAPPVGFDVNLLVSL